MPPPPRMPSIEDGLLAIERRWPNLAGQDDEDSPVFILAAGWRSGSTLLQRLLSERCLIWGEPYGHAGLIPSLADPIRCFTDRWPEPHHFYRGHPPEALATTFIANLYPGVSDLRRAHRGFFERLFAEPARAAGHDRWGLKEVRLDADHALYLRWLFPAPGSSSWSGTRTMPGDPMPPAPRGDGGGTTDGPMSRSRPAASRRIGTGSSPASWTDIGRSTASWSGTRSTRGRTGRRDRGPSRLRIVARGGPRQSRRRRAAAPGGDPARGCPHDRGGTGAPGRLAGLRARGVPEGSGRSDVHGAGEPPEGLLPVRRPRPVPEVHRAGVRGGAAGARASGLFRAPGPGGRRNRPGAQPGRHGRPTRGVRGAHVDRSRPGIRPGRGRSASVPGSSPGIRRLSSAAAGGPGVERRR